MKAMLFLPFCLLVFLQAHADDTTFARNLIHYLGIEENVSAEDISMLAKAKSKAESPDLTVDQRKDAYKELFQLSVRLQKSNPPPSVIDMLVSSAISWTCPGESEIASPLAKPGELEQVIKVGNGEIPIILIPDVGMDGNVFQLFIDRNKSNYKMYAVTLPGFGGTPALPSFEKRDYTARRLWKNAEDAILNLIQKENLKAPIVLGHQAGAYLALRLALDHPQNIRAVVVLNGLLYSPMVISKDDPSGKLTPEFRDRLAKLFLPIELFPRPSRECFSKYWQNVGGTMSKDPQRNLQLAQNGGKSDAHLTWDYGAELMTTDLSAEITELKIPALVIPSITDPKEKPHSITQWKAVEISSVKIVPVENVGTFALDDKPEFIDKVIRDFITAETQRNE